ncbi:hypothetical protein [Streptomyces sp. NBC_01530]|uniref:hypothetical protein n=1 Tax=Streptomyces sp. NBC_01530 TaxID=2903895 RepID=UPI00386FDBE1
MRGAEAAGPALDDQQQAQVELVEGQPVLEGRAEVEIAARFGVAGDEVAVRTGVAAESERDQFGCRVTEFPDDLAC